MTGLTAEQYTKLLKPLAASRVKTLQDQSHLEAWDVRRHLIRFFGFGGYDLETKTLDLVREIQHPPMTKDGRPDPEGRSRWTVIYRAEVRLTIKDPDGFPFAVFEDAAAGDSINQPALGDAHDHAMKTALSQALKRCAVNMGDQFGLSLYDDGSTQATVVRSLVAPEMDEEARNDGRTDDGDRGGADPGQAGPGAGPDRPDVGGRGPGRDRETGSPRPGVLSGVHRRVGLGGSAQAPGDGRDAPATVGG